MVLYNNKMEGLGIRKPFARQGGKSRLADIIVKKFPVNYENLKYIEPFAGGASIYFYKKPSKVEVLNDLDPKVYTLLKGFKNFDGNNISNKLNNIPSTKENFKRILDSKPTTEYDKFIRLLYLTKNSFFSRMQTHSGGRSPKTNYGSKYTDRLLDTIISNKSYEELIKEHDGPNTLFYFDPPYEASKGIYENYVIDYVKMNKLLEHIKGKFILSINSNPEFLKIFKNFKVETVKTLYIAGRSGSKNKKTATEYIFKNY